MPLGSFGNVPDRNASSEELADAFSRLLKEVTYLLNGGLDTLNVNELNADVINAGVLNALLVVVSAALTGATITIDGNGFKAVYATGTTITIDQNGFSIINGTKTPFTADVNGLVTMIGALVQSAAGYPKVELNSGSNLFAAYKTATDKVTLNPNLTDSPSWIFDNGSATANLGNVLALFWINCITGNMQISSNQNVNIKAGLGGTGTVNFDAWSNVKNAATSQTLQAAFDAKANNSLVNGTVYVSSTSGGPATTPITFTNGVRTG